MIKIKHRVNSLDDLSQTNIMHGVEIDIRANTADLYISHDPFLPGCLLSEYLEVYKHRFLILNVKEDGLEDRIIQLLNKHKIEEYFFLDQPFPTLRKNQILERSCAVRVSEYERLPIGFQIPSWIWIDSFTGNWDHLVETMEFANLHSIKTCIVSPELQGRDDSSEILEIQRLLSKCGKSNDAVCTKLLEAW